MSTANSNFLFGGVARHSLIYGAGAILARAVSFVMLPIYTRYLTTADYGVMALIDLTLDFVSIVAGARLALGVFRFYHKEDNEDARCQIASTAFLLICGLYCIMGAAVFAVASPVSMLLFGSGANAGLIRLAAVNVALGSLAIVPLALAQVKDLSGLYVGASMLNMLFLVVMELGLTGVFLASLIANAVVGAFLGAWIIRTCGLRWSSAWTSDLLRYGVPLMGSQVGTFLATFSDRYFLQAAADESSVGLYNLAYQFGFLLVMVGVTPMYQVWAPKRFKIAREENADELLSRGLLIMSVLMFSTFVGISLYVGDVLRVMATPAFWPASQYVTLILIAYVFQSWANCVDIGVLLEERTGFLAFANAVSAVVAVVGYSLFVPRYLAWGAAGVTVVAFAVRFILTYAFAQRLRRVRYEWRPVLVLVVWAGLITLAGYLLPTMGLVLSLSLRTGLVLLFFVGLWLLPILQVADRSAVRRVVYRVAARRKG